MSALDVVALPGHAGMFARRVAVVAWQRAGAPRVNSAGRLYALQKHFWDGWRLRKPGFQPADNPDDETQRLAHVRFVAFDIDPTPDRIRRLTAAGFVRPYWYELWHWELPNVRSYSIVRSIPSTASDDFTPIPKIEQDDTMQIHITDNEGRYGPKNGYYWTMTGQAWNPSSDRKMANAVSVYLDKSAYDCAYYEWEWFKATAPSAKVAPVTGAPNATPIDYAALAKAVNDDAAARLAN